MSCPMVNSMQASGSLSGQGQVQAGKKNGAVYYLRVLLQVHGLLDFAT